MHTAPGSRAICRYSLRARGASQLDLFPFGIPVEADSRPLFGSPWRHRAGVPGAGRWATPLRTTQWPIESRPVLTTQFSQYSFHIHAIIPLEDKRRVDPGDAHVTHVHGMGQSAGLIISRAASPACPLASSKIRSRKCTYISIDIERNTGRGNLAA